MPKEIKIYHSPDADDAFMFYGISSGAVSNPEIVLKHELGDIESLNQRALAGELDCTAVSVHAVPYLKNQYAIMRSGASMGGQDYGPVVVSKSGTKLSDGKTRTIAIPGLYTSAALALKLYMAENNIEAELVNINFDQVFEAVLSSKVDAGIIIHEGQLTHTELGLASVLNLGTWWWEKHQLPLPLGVNIVRCSLGEETMQTLSRALRASIEYGHKHRDEALTYALGYGRGITKAQADKFVGMYVNQYTIDLGESGIRSIEIFLRAAVDRGFVPSGFTLRFV